MLILRRAIDRSDRINRSRQIGFDRLRPTEDFFKTEISQTSLDEFYGKPMLVFRSAPEASWQALAKQGIEEACR